MTSRLKVILPLTIFSLSLTLFSWAQLSGFEKGFFYGVFSEPSMNGFSGGGPNYYQSLNYWYLLISCFLFVSLVARFSKNITGSIVAAAALCITAIAFLEMTVFFKNEIIGMELCCEQYPWLVSSMYFDLFSLGIVIILLAIEILFLLRQGNKMQSISEAIS